MIVVKLIGGLGNQMFQYAAGRSLALKLETKLFLNIDSYQKGKSRLPRDFELYYFPNCRKIAEIQSLRLVSRLKARIINLLIQNSASGLFKEKTFSFDSNFNNLLENSTLEGYFQSYKYFDDIRDILRDDFNIEFQDEANKELALKLSSRDSVSVHIRRGDYISDKKVAAIHLCCEQDYYDRAFKLIEAKIENPNYFVFSDDINWVERNMNFSTAANGRLEFVKHNFNQSSYLDMALMSKASHHIIANSSFSWWAAYLAKNDQGLKIAPAKWFNDNSIDIKDLMPESWIKI